MCENIITLLYSRLLRYLQNSLHQLYGQIMSTDLNRWSWHTVYIDSTELRKRNLTLQYTVLEKKSHYRPWGFQEV